MKTKLSLAMVLVLALGAQSALAEQFFRWTKDDGVKSDLSALIQKVNEASGWSLRADDFKLTENRHLAYTSYARYDQVVAGVPIHDMSLRVWTADKTGEVVQFEANVENSAAMKTMVSKTGSSRIARDKAEKIARAVLMGKRDSRVGTASYELAWQKGVLTHRFAYKGKRGKHMIAVNAVSGAIVEQSYTAFPDADRINGGGDSEFSTQALVYPIYEEYKNQILPRQTVTLSHLKSVAQLADHDPFETLRDHRYLYSLEDPIKAATPEGQAEGYWSYVDLQARATALAADVPSVINGFGKTGALLQGQYVGINIHPDVLKIVTPTQPLWYTPNLVATWKSLPDGDGELIPSGALAGKRWQDESALVNADATRDPKHDVAKYMASGFDEIQVYYAVSELFDALRPRGFTDDELSTRPFQAYLFNPDIEMRDNAYYDADTINFTTYSPSQPNMARDNLTIWHELGHGVMDRIMGTRLNLADTGGLSEGMADFVAEMVSNVVNANQDFPGVKDQRIVNQTGFFLTNEVHDDGEAYGGTMKVILDAAKAASGRAGVDQVVDLTLEAMRLSRDHPHLTAQDWFDHVLYADALGRDGLRAPGALHDIILNALESRNFADEQSRADLSVAVNGREIIAGQPGSRDHEIPVTLAADAQKTFPVKITLRDGKEYKFHYPVKIRIFFTTGALEGAIHWQGEEKEPKEFTFNSSGESVDTDLTIDGKCDFVNREEGVCSDYAYVQVWNDGDAAPAAKKRFYVRLTTKAQTGL